MTDKESEWRELLDRLLNLAEESDFARPSFPSINSRLKKDSELVDLAKSEIKRRSIRSKYLPHQIFAEGGWNILLDLFVQEADFRPVSVTSACYASDVPTTTALRHIATLIDCGLIEKSQPAHDKRLTYLRLTSAGKSALRAVLSAFA